MASGSGVTLVIEISDHRTRAFDTGIKRDEYQAAGLPEYWIVDAADPPRK